ncbi:MAG: DUF6600 domain-containing protein [Methylococcales bacterium]
MNADSAKNQVISQGQLNMNRFSKISSKVLFLFAALIISIALVSKPAAANTSLNLFYAQLAPHGKWFDHRTYGRVWQPRGISKNWRPYTEGRWIYTEDYGWYWEADQEWGWAAFHYGRWAYDNFRGWLWIPGTVWAPAWVSWQYGNGYSSWAPLPPEIYWQPQTGLSFSYFNISSIPVAHWVVMSDSYFGHGRVREHVLPVYQNNIYINNVQNHVTYVTVNNNHIVNPGVPKQHLENELGTPIQSVRVRQIDNIPKSGVARHVNNEVQIIRPPIEQLAPPSENQERDLAAKISKANKHQVTESTEQHVTGSILVDQPKVVPATKTTPNPPTVAKPIEQVDTAPALPFGSLTPANPSTLTDVNTAMPRSSAPAHHEIKTLPGPRQTNTNNVKTQSDAPRAISGPTIVDQPFIESTQSGPSLNLPENTILPTPNEINAPSPESNRINLQIPSSHTLQHRPHSEVVSPVIVQPMQPEPQNTQLHQADQLSSGPGPAQVQQLEIQRQQEQQQQMEIQRRGEVQEQRAAQQQVEQQRQSEQQRQTEMQQQQVVLQRQQEQQQQSELQRQAEIQQQQTALQQVELQRQLEQQRQTEMQQQQVDLQRHQEQQQQSELQRQAEIQQQQAAQQQVELQRQLEQQQQSEMQKQQLELQRQQMQQMEMQRQAEVQQQHAEQQRQLEQQRQTEMQQQQQMEIQRQAEIQQRQVEQQRQAEIQQQRAAQQQLEQRQQSQPQ